MSPKKMVFAGDSHTGVFYPFYEEVMAIYDRPGFTIDAFSRGHSQVYKDFVEFLMSLNRNGMTLILCLSEVDIRVHFWRDMPIFAARGMSFEKFIANKVAGFIRQVHTLVGETRISNIILWGAPASQLTAENHTESLPATGDNQTRNILTHLFNTEMMRQVAGSGGVLRFATPFYGMVNEQFVTDTRWLRDGVHLKFELRPHCMSLLLPLIEMQSSVTFSKHFDPMAQMRLEYQLAEKSLAEMQNIYYFRTWVKTDKTGAETTGLTLDNSFGHFRLIDRFDDLQERSSYQELVLRRIQ